MALKKEKVLANGAIGYYWKIIRDTANYSTKECEFVVALFKDESFSSKKDLGMHKVFKFKFTPEELTQDRRSVAYGKIKDLTAGEVVSPFTGSAIQDLDLKDSEDV